MFGRLRTNRLLVLRQSFFCRPLHISVLGVDAECAIFEEQKARFHRLQLAKPFLSNLFLQDLFFSFFIQVDEVPTEHLFALFKVVAQNKFIQVFEGYFGANPLPGLLEPLLNLSDS